MRKNGKELPVYEDILWDLEDFDNDAQEYLTTEPDAPKKTRKSKKSGKNSDSDTIQTIETNTEDEKNDNANTQN